MGILDLGSLATELETENPRSAAIVAAAVLDETLRSKLLKLFTVSEKTAEDSLFKSGSGPLGTFSSRIDLTYCLGAISKKQKDDLHLIRKIRNKFAHDLNASFDSSSIHDQCAALSEADADGHCPADPRDRFTKSALRLILIINPPVT